MNLKLHSTDNIRLTTGSKDCIFLDIRSEHQEQSLTVMFLTSHQYMEVRKKNGQVKTFYFENKGTKKYFDFEYWSDAEVIFAFNEVIHEQK